MSEPTFRPVISVVRRAPDDTVMEVTLDLDGWIADGTAEVEEGDLLTAAGAAACEAVSSLLPEGVEVRLESVQLMSGAQWSRDVVMASVSLHVEGERVGEELIGAAFVRTDHQVAAVRATLDGLTRRLSRFLEE